MATRESESPSLEAGEIRVGVACSGVSPGTESRCFSWEQPGTPREGFIPGYQCVGRVVESASDLYREGDLVFCTGGGRGALPRMWGAHSSELVIPATNAYRLPPHAPARLSAVAKLAAIARHGVRLAAPSPLERIAVVGLGPVGFFSASILHALGFHPVAFDLSARRCELFAALGGRAVSVDPAAPLAEQIRAEICPDVLIDATGAAALLDELISAGPELPWGENARSGLRLVVQGSYPGEVRFDYDTAFTREVSLLFPRDNTPADLREVLGWMACGMLRLPDGALGTARPDDAQSVYESFRPARDLPLTHVFDWTT